MFINLFSHTKNGYKKRKQQMRHTSYLPRIEELTEKLPVTPTLTKIVDSAGQPLKPRYIQSIKGFPIEEWGIFKQKGAAASICQGRRGSIAKQHVHTDAIEYYVVFRGKLKSILFEEKGSRTTIVEKGDIAIIPRGFSHTCEILDDATFFVLTIPAAAGMPNSPVFPGIKDE
jgi:quercetin dioxygenase-like cupin family protein